MQDINQKISGIDQHVVVVYPGFKFNESGNLIGRDVISLPDKTRKFPFPKGETIAELKGKAYSIRSNGLPTLILEGVVLEDPIINSKEDEEELKAMFSEAELEEMKLNMPGFLDNYTKCKNKIKEESP